MTSNIRTISGFDALLARPVAAVGLAALLALPASALAAERHASSRPAASGAAAVAGARGAATLSLPRSIGDLQPVFEQHGRRGGGGGGHSGGGGGGQAVPRGSSGGSGGGSTSGGSQSGGSVNSGSSGGDSGTARPRSDGGSTADTSGLGSSGSTPPHSRPRDGQPTTGTAVQRTGGKGGGSTVIVGGGYYGGFYPWGWGGLGLGGYYGYYDPWMWGDPYPPSGVYDHDGGLKLKVSPNDAEVFVDGYFAGTVDDYDGVFQQLHLNPGPHRIEVRLEGFETLSFEVRIEPGRTVTYKGELRRVGGERRDRDDDDRN